VLLLVLGLFAVVVVHVVLAQQQFQLAHIASQVSAQQGANEQLSLQVAQLQAPARIVSAAEQQMGMVSPPSVGYLLPGHTGAPKVRAPAAAASGPSGSSGTVGNGGGAPSSGASGSSTPTTAPPGHP